MIRDKLFRIAILLVILAVAVTLDAFQPQNVYSISGLAYDSSKSASIEIRTPANLSDRFGLRFDALADDAAYDNVIQASGASGPTLRLVVQPPHQLVLILFGIDESPITLSDAFVLHAWHHVAFNGAPNGDLDASVDGSVTHLRRFQIRQLQSSAEIGSKDFAFRFTRVKAGLDASPLRNFRGKIANLHLTARYIERPPWPFVVFAGILVAFSVLWLLSPWLLGVGRVEISSVDVVVLVVIAIVTPLGFLADAFLPVGKLAIWLAMGAGVICAVAAARTFHTAPLSKPVSALGLSCVVTIGALSILTLPNSITTIRMFEQWPVTSAFCVTLALCVAIITLDAAARERARPQPLRWLAWSPYLLFALLALRTDSVVAPINALHWEYFVGPIRALREGGWLLWDVPSQYGFLTVLLPAMLPIRPAAEAFYAFQAAALFLAAAVFYRTLYVLRVNWLVACALVVAFFFLADPLLIGPAPYPSMSAVRFLWCYVLLAMAATNFLGERPSVVRLARTGVIVWILGILWSAESAIYVTVIFLTPLCVGLVLQWRRQPSPQAKLRAGVELLGLPLVGALAIFAVIEAAYQAGLGHGPDWSMFGAYSWSYGGGYGERAVPIFGAILIFAFVLFGGAAAFVHLLRKGAEGSAYAVATAVSVVWIVSSYYVGRAYPITVTMLSPLLIFAVFTIVRSTASAGKKSVLAVLAVPLLAVGLVSSFWNPGVTTVVRELRTPNLNLPARLPQADPELAQLLRRARISPLTRVVYYDTWVAMPRSAQGPFDRVWLPTPLQDLEEPIPATVRDRVVRRFVSRRPMSGYFVQVTSGSNVPAGADAWFALLKRFYSGSEVARSQNYRIWQFSLR